MAKSNNLRVIPSRKTYEVAAARPPVDKFLGELIHRIDLIDGAVGLARDAVFREAERSQDLARAWCAMELALKELNRMREDVESAQLGSLRP